MKKNDEKLPVSTLCKKAGVSRAGFYVYYKDMEDFIDQGREYIVNRLFEQMMHIMKVEDNKQSRLNSLILTDTDIDLFKIYIGKHAYQDFALAANRVIFPKYEVVMIERWGEEYYEKNKQVFEFAFNGAFSMLVIDLLDFDKNTFIKNMGRITGIMKALFPYYE